ncbi:helix-turn-helix domain-containing protein [Bosea sp. (in: a-proteobacteria)]|uniref:helix-turn-helix domain-containing protein n=1 Tax=Bosea sp. (in: a-proteobacteria) TaxID=1871050 RepID=UPI002634155E|nr:AraC family transcriptional regulator [Bosea sp. (in: a-proteobacteria)]MCO5089630.1 AraC family transcriptional regulator [Bosea sp. (in: a-proteobacteria)]
MRIVSTVNLPTKNKVFFTDSQNQTSEEIVSTVMNFVNDRLNSKISLKDIEEIVNCSVFRVIRAFRKELGLTPHAFIIQQRIYKSLELLELGEPAAGIAVDLGFVDQSHFSRHFKRILGETPSRYRERAASSAVKERRRFAA